MEKMNIRFKKSKMDKSSRTKNEEPGEIQKRKCKTYTLYIIIYLKNNVYNSNHKNGAFPDLSAIPSFENRKQRLCETADRRAAVYFKTSLAVPAKTKTAGCCRRFPLRRSAHVREGRDDQAAVRLASVSSSMS